MRAGHAPARRAAPDHKALGRQIVASIEQPEVIAKILAHLERTAPQPHPPDLPGMPGRGFGRADVG